MIFFDESPMVGSMRDYPQTSIEIANATDLEPLWDEMIRRFHYLGFGKMIGQRIKYIVREGERPVAALSYNRAALRVGVRDTYIGWTDEGRRQNLKYVVSNHRYLILPWVRVKNLASHILGLSLRRLKRDWRELYGYEPELVETFVGERYKGTCYLASNWLYIGETKGFGKVGNKFEYHGHRKKVFLYELDKGFIESLSPNLRRPPVSEEHSKVKVNFTDYSPSIIGATGLAKEDVGLFNDEYISYMGKYTPCFGHMAQLKHFRTYGVGLMSNSPRKSMRPIVLEVSDEGTGITPRSMQQFMRRSTWSTDAVKKTYQRLIAGLVFGDDVAIAIDATIFGKHGKRSVGVGLRRLGDEGKADSSQMAVVCGLVSADAYALMDYALYFQRHWFDEDHESLRIECEVPKDLRYKPKNKLALDLLLLAYGKLPYMPSWVCADAVFGQDKEFLDSIPVNYFADINPGEEFHEPVPDVQVPTRSGRDGRQFVPEADGESLAASRIIEDSQTPWEKVSDVPGDEGHMWDEKIIRVSDIRNGRPDKPVWLYARRFLNGDIRYSISNAPEDTPIEKFRDLARRRLTVERTFEECKSDLGLTHFGGRSYIGWHRHVLIVMIINLFLQLMGKKGTVDHEQSPEEGQQVPKSADET